jgi:hypothetical protein
LLEIKDKYKKILTVEDYLNLKIKPDVFCIIRHDVDRNPVAALKMSKIEKELSVRSTYYFRLKNNTFIPDVFMEIHSLGHEIGYHYECLSDSNGDIDKALLLFEEALNRFKQYLPIRTICMHGRPLSGSDNRNMWVSKVNHDLLNNKYGLLGEVYLDIDYSDILYVSDTGRNWVNNRSNIYDIVDSKIKLNFKNGSELLKYLSGKPHSKLIFQTHPERWTDNVIDYIAQVTKDIAINTIKKIICYARN